MSSAALAAVLDHYRARPFRWGECDCVTFAADVLHVLCRRDPLAGLPPWSSRAEALRLLRRLGGLRQAVTNALQAPPRPGAMARPFDVVLLGATRLGICNGTHHLAPAPAGLAVVPWDHAIACWSWGRDG